MQSSHNSSAFAILWSLLAHKLVKATADSPDCIASRIPARVCGWSELGGIGARTRPVTYSPARALPAPPASLLGCGLRILDKR
jgi:hypothetical protein